MQSKKRAKPVKFGKDKKKENVEPHKKEETLKKSSVTENVGELPKEELEKKTLSDKEEKEAGNQDVLDEGETGKGSSEKVSAAVDEVEDKEREEDLEDEKSEEASDDDSADESDEITQELDPEDMESNPEEERSAEEFFSKPPDAYDENKGTLKFFLTVVLITFVVGMVLFGGIYYGISNKDKLLSLVNKPSPTPSEAPQEVSPTNEPVDLAEFDIRVLNGTSTSGLAASLQEDLKEAGFKVVSVGNADSDDFDRTEIAAVEKVSKEFLDKLREELGKSYIVGETVKLSTGEADVVITIGSASAR
jgi:hypothetical protein